MILEFCPAAHLGACLAQVSSVGYSLYASPMACCTAPRRGDAPCRVRRSQVCSCQGERVNDDVVHGAATRQASNMVSLATVMVALVGRLSGGRRPAYWSTFFYAQT
jgi:hypothetical protein